MKPWAERQATLARLGYPTYTDYLASERWAVIRGTVLARDGHRCACGARASQVHHRRYSEPDLTGETLAFMTAVCEPCHRFGSKDGDRFTTPNEADARMNALVTLRPKAPGRNGKLRKRLKAIRNVELSRKSRSVAHQHPDGTWDVSGTAGRFRT